MSLPAALARGEILHLVARIRHTRLGALRHAFDYGADFLLFSPEEVQTSRGLLRRNGFGLFSLADRDHGGARGDGQGATWVWAQLAFAGIARTPDMVLGLLTQPRLLGLGFNPVSFWILWRGQDLVVLLAEVNNTFGQRHSYLCHLPDLAPISARDLLQADKVFHVSPFQDVAGGYGFRLGLRPEHFDLLITHRSDTGGLVARMQGALRPLRQRALLWSALRRPAGGLRILALIFLQALRLKLKGARYRPLPPPPVRDISL